MTPHATAPAALRRDTARELAVAAALAAAVSTTLAATTALPAHYPAAVLLASGGAGWWLWRGLPAHAPHHRFGAANRVTLARLLGVLLLAGTLVQPASPDWVWGDAAWACVVLATLAAVMDAADGPLARRSGLASDFGARFDMETDALLIAVLALLVWHWGKVPAWVLLAGGLRYAFVAAAAVWPWMNRALPDSLRRKTVCVLQIVLLIVGLGPVIPVAAATALAAAGLALLLLSFAVDTGWLLQRRALPLPPHPAPNSETLPPAAPDAASAAPPGRANQRPDPTRETLR